jgi:hypothetical protein
MLATYNLNMLMIGEIDRINRRFVHELWPYVNEENFPEFVRRYEEIMNRKWLEYSNLN